MSTSCLDRSLISSAVSGTGVNVSLLIQALTPLCPKPTTPVDVAANHFATVVTGYVCGFLPWGFVALFDFISAKWKTVHATRRAGRLHIIASVVPMLVVIVYAVLQALSADYKEMMTAVIAIVLTVYHIARTLWGLIQLGEYVKWCRYTLQCIRATRPKLPWHVWKSDSDDEDDADIDLSEALMVNEDIVDNEFHGRDISVCLTLPNGKFFVSNPELCTVRWSAAFLCSLGHHWKSRGCKLLHRDLTKYLCFSPLHLNEMRSDTPSSSFLEFSLTLFSKGLSCGAFGSTIFAKVMANDMLFESYTFDFDNIVSSYPPCNDSEDVPHNRQDASIGLVDCILAARNLTDYVHRSRKAAPNAYILDSSLQCDNLTCLDLAEFILLTINIDEIYEAPDDDVFEKYSILLKSKPIPWGFILGISLDSVRTLLAQWVLLQKNLNLACWRPHVPTQPISFVPSHFLLQFHIMKDRSSTSNLVLSECQNVLHKRLALLDLHDGHFPASPEIIALLLLSYPALIIEVLKDEHDRLDRQSGIVEYKITPVIAPQQLTLSLLITPQTSNASLRIVSGKQGMRFEWENWINAAMGLLKGHNQSVKNMKSENINKFVGPLELIKKVDLSRPILTFNRSNDDDVLSKLPGQLCVWSAWPIFDLRFCQFELDLWMEACGSLPNDQHFAGVEYGKRKNTAIETLEQILEWNRA